MTARSAGKSHVVAVASLLLLSACTSTPAPSLPTASASSDVAVDAGVVYRTVGGKDLHADICRKPAAATPRPVVLLVHGGGFDSGESTGMRSMCERVARAGSVGVAVDYRLSTDDVFPAQVQDVAAAVDWVTGGEQVTRYGIDPARVGVLGSSAGAIIAESIGVGMGGNVTPVGAVVALSGASELTEEGLRLGKPRPEAQEVILRYLGCSDISECPAATEASPLQHVTPSTSPMLLLAGSDELVPAAQSQAMSDALGAAGVDHQLVIEEGSNHGMDLLSAKNLTTIDDFLTSRL